MKNEVDQMNRIERSPDVLTEKILSCDEDLMSSTYESISGSDYSTPKDLIEDVIQAYMSDEILHISNEEDGDFEFDTYSKVNAMKNLLSHQIKILDNLYLNGAYELENVVFSNHIELHKIKNNMILIDVDGFKNDNLDTLIDIVAERNLQIEIRTPYSMSTVWAENCVAIDKFNRYRKLRKNCHTFVERLNSDDVKRIELKRIIYDL